MNDSTINLIEQWMMNCIETKSWQRFDDLHVDVISSEFKKRDKWLEGSIQSIEQAVQIRNNKDLNYSLTLVVPLISSNEPKCLSFNTLNELQNLIHKTTPPSIYLFKSTEMNWIETFSEAIKINHEISEFSFDAELYYQESFCEDESEFNRNIWVVSHHKTTYN